MENFRKSPKLPITSHLNVRSASLILDPLELAFLANQGYMVQIKAI